MPNLTGQDEREEISHAIPYPTIRRMPAYHRYLKGLQSDGLAMVSCTRIAESLDLEPIQVRKDLAMTGTVGRPRIGYPVDALIGAIETVLGWDRWSEAFLVGAGNLGSAILGYRAFKAIGLNIVAAFDIDPRRVGKMIHDVPVLAMEKLANLARRMKIRIGVITVPAEAAEDAAKALVRGGIEAIWNFSPLALTGLHVGKDVIIENVSLASSLAVLIRRLGQTKAAQP
ncbi:MAG: redox-sensing transcriptional repressor Rex [Planctomycetota bacterium]|nr:redox-sensing transcriptional repressor Rex [Planctomycetota bacterium]